MAPYRTVAAACSLLGVLALAACGTPTPYQPSGVSSAGYGYSEQPVEAHRYRVTFSGNTLTPRDTVENYLLYRAAELTLDAGGDYFVIADRDVERKTTYTSTFSGFGGYGYGGFYDPWYRPHAFSGLGSSTSMPHDSYRGVAEIVVHKGRKPAGAPEAYDARQVIERLGPTLRRAP
jgi:hypothetical protein